jgi:hypothetical protein
MRRTIDEVRRRSPARRCWSDDRQGQAVVGSTSQDVDPDQLSRRRGCPGDDGDPARRADLAARVVATDKQLDLAVLKVDARNLSTVML